jgi:hypothetical protein
MAFQFQTSVGLDDKLGRVSYRPKHMRQLFWCGSVELYWDAGDGDIRRADARYLGLVSASRGLVVECRMAGCSHAVVDQGLPNSANEIVTICRARTGSVVVAVATSVALCELVSVSPVARFLFECGLL